MATKSIFLSTNFNNKLHCPVMIHLDVAPWASIPESVAEKSVIEFIAQDGSYPPSRWKLVDLYRAPFSSISSIITWPSHGMDKFDCYQCLKAIHPDLNEDTPMAVYYYKKISE